MYPYSRNVTPAAKNHLEAQLAFFNGISKSLFHSVQQISDLHVQLAQSLLEEATIATHNLITVERPEDAFRVAAASGQPATEQLRVYQQQLSRVAADSQVELANVAEQHVAETSRTAKALAEEVARTASEETEKTCASSRKPCSASPSLSRASRMATVVSSAVPRAVKARACKAVARVAPKAAPSRPVKAPAAVRKHRPATLRAPKARPAAARSKSVGIVQV